MPKKIEEMELKKLIIGLFMSNLFLIGVICPGAAYVHNQAIKDLKDYNKESKVEMKEIRKDISDIKVAFAGFAK